MAKRKSSARRIRIAYIGGGSRGWAHTLMNDLAACPHLTGEVALYDIDRPAAMLNARWARRVNASPQAKSYWKYSVSKTLSQAMKGADFVVASIQPGPMEMMGDDLAIPARYGIIHPVADTVGPAGLCRTLRAVPEYAHIARAVQKYCPDAWVINYTNPMTACTRTLYKTFPQIKAFGCCHEVFSTQHMLAGLMDKHHGVKAKRSEIRVNVLGVNHFTWIDKADYNGLDLLALYRKHIRTKGFIRKIGEEEIQKMGYWDHRGQITADLFRRYGIMPAAGERHIVEFLPFYLKDVATIHRWGVRLTPYSARIERYTGKPGEFRKRLADKTPFKVRRSDEEAVRQMMAVLGMGDMLTNVNLPNVGQIDNLPREAVVETNALFTPDSVKPQFAGSLPAGVQPLVARVVATQEMIVEAALTCDKDLAFQAFLNDPLMSITTDRAWKMFNEMLRATKAMLPGWKI